MAVVLQAANGDPLQRRPAVGSIPLLAAAADLGGGQPARGQQAGTHGCRDRCRLVGIGHAHEQRRQGRGGEVVALPAAPPVIVEVGAGARIPQVVVDRCQANFGAPRKILGTGLLALHRRQLGDLPLELVEQRIEVDGQDAGGADGRQPVRIVQPARAEVPARFGTGAQVTINLVPRPATGAGGLDVFAIGLLARRIALVPVTVEHHAVGQADAAPVPLTGAQRIGTLHPEGIFLVQLRQVIAGPVHAVFLE